MVATAGLSEQPCRTDMDVQRNRAMQAANVLLDCFIYDHADV